MKTTEHDRRRFLQLTGTGAAATLAGCADLNPLSDGDDGGEYDDLLTAAVGPANEEIRELQEAIENEEIDMAEAQERESELIEAAVADFEERAETDDELEIVDANADRGLYRIDSSATAAIEALQEGSVLALYEGAAYDQILEQQQQQPEPEPAPDEDDPDEDELGEGDDADGDENGADDADSAADDGDEAAPDDDDAASDGDESDEDGNGADDPDEDDA